MLFNRRQTLGLFGSVLAAPYIIRPSSAAEPVEYVKVCDAFGTGFYYIPGSDVRLRVGSSGDANGFSVVSIRDPAGVLTPATGRLDSYNLNGSFLHGSKLGSPDGPTSGDRVSLCSLEKDTISSGGSVAIYCVPRDDAGPSESDEVFTQRFSAQSQPLGKPRRINAILDGGHTTLFTAPIGNNIAIGYTHNTAAGFRARRVITDGAGVPIAVERAVTAGTTDLEFLTNVATSTERIFWGIASIDDGKTTHWVQRADALGQRLGNLIQIRPPTGQDIHGSPTVLPNPDGSITTFYWTGVDSDTARLNFQRYETNGTRGPVKPLGLQGTENFATIASPRVCRLPGGDALVLTEGIGTIIAWVVAQTGALKDRQPLRKNQNKRYQLRRLRRIRQMLAACWTESDHAQSIQSRRWGVEVFRMSDVRLKRDIVPVARHSDGICLYRYRYQWSDIEYVGVMAQEVAEVRPDAVVRGADGYLAVDYGKLGLKLQTWPEWEATHALSN